MVEILEVFTYVLSPTIVSTEVSNSLIKLAMRGPLDREAAPLKFSQFFNTPGLVIHNLVAGSHV